MNYGTSAYGSTPIGGSVASEWFVFFPILPVDARDPDVLYESKLEYGGSGLFSIFTRQASEAESAPSGVTYKIYTANDSSETPQLQATQEGDGQVVIGAARFITVTALIDGTLWTSGQRFDVRGRPGG